MTHVIPVGTSEPQDFLLQDDGEALDGTGFTVTLEVSDAEGASVEGSPSGLFVAWLDQAAGTVRVTGTEELELGSYYVRFRLTDALGTVGFTPNGGRPDLWRVVKVT